MLRRTGRRAHFLVVMLVAALAVGLSAPAANAALVVPKGGEAALTIDFQNFYFKLGQKNIYSLPIAPATVDFTTGTANFPIKGGLVETNTMLGTVDLDGGLRIIQYNASQTAVEQEILVTSPRIVNGSILAGNAFELVPSPSADFKNTEVSHPDSGTTVFRAADVTMNVLTAPVLNLYFGTDAFEGGMRLGSWRATIEH